MQRFNPVAPSFILYFSWENISPLSLWGGCETLLNLLVDFTISGGGLLYQYETDDGVSFVLITKLKHIAFLRISVQFQKKKERKLG